jgi:hypothetical protein
VNQKGARLKIGCERKVTQTITVDRLPHPPLVKQAGG